MDYRSQIKEKMGKLLFLEMNIEGFKESINIPKYVKFKNKDLYLPISTEYISSNIENEIKIKNLPIYYFIEGMFITFGCDENLRFNDDYELILDYIKDIKLIKPIELYSIWLDEKVDVEYSTVFIDNLNEEIILNIINNYHSSLIIK